MRFTSIAIALMMPLAACGMEDETLETAQDEEALFAASRVSGITQAVDGGGEAYFFKGKQYITYNWALDRAVGDPKPIVGNWAGVPF